MLFRIFNWVILLLNGSIILPVNAYRLHSLNQLQYLNNLYPLIFFGIMYAHNLIMCISETRFVLRCYVLYTKFAKINRDADRLNESVLGHGTSAYVEAGRPLVDSIERLKFRHRLIRDAVDDLNRAFAVPLVMSLCNLCIMAMFDIYYQVINVYVQHTNNRSVVYIYFWITQYMFRLFMIVMTTHAMMLQASVP